MSHTRLKRELHFLLAHCSFRRIARLYNKFGARDDYFALFVGEYVENMGMKNIKILQPLIEHYMSYKQDEKQVLSSDEEETQPRERMSDDSADEADDEAESTQAGPSTSTGLRFHEDTEFLLCTSTSDEDISSEDNLSQTAVKDKDSPPAVLTSSEEEDAPEASGNEANAPNGVDDGVSSAYSAGEAVVADPRGERDVAEAQSSTRRHQPPSPAYSHTPPPDDPAPSALQREEDSLPPPAPHPSAASNEEDDSESFYSSSDNESTASRREFSNILRNFSEPRSAILNVITNRNGDGDTAGGSAIARFYTRRATPQEREGHRIEDRNRLVYERFDETDIMDRRVNEGQRPPHNQTEQRNTSGSERDARASASESVQAGAGRSADYRVAGPGKRFVLEKETTQYLTRFRATGKILSLRLKKPPHNANPILWLESAVRDIHAYIHSFADDGTNLIGVAIKSDSLEHGPGGLSLRPAENFSHEDLWSLIEGLAQSNDDLKVDETFLVEVTLIEVPRGRGRKKGKKYLSIDSLAQRSVVSINNADDLCLPRALVVGNAHLRMKQNDTEEARKQWGIIRDGRRPLQKYLAKKLVRESRVIIPPGGCGYRELEKFQKYFSREGIAIVAFEKNFLGSGEAAFFDGRSKIESRIRGSIFVLYDPQLRHYDTITNLVGACRSNFYCENRNRRYWYIDDHKCPAICLSCFVRPARKMEDVEMIKCNRCNRNFFGEQCCESQDARNL